MTSPKAPGALDRYVGNRIRMRRLELGMSQEKLGEALGITFQQVQKYEKGTNRVSVSRLHHIAETLGVPLTYFYEGGIASGLGSSSKSGRAGANAENAAALISDFLAAPDAPAVARGYLKLTAAERRQVVQLVQQLSGGNGGKRPTKGRATR